MSRSALVLFAALPVVAGALACATLPPKELRDARASYERAASGYAAQLEPVSLGEARDALAAAELAWRDDPHGTSARDLAYIADRRARLAEARANTRFAERRGKKANDELRALAASPAAHVANPGHDHGRP